MCLSTIEPDSRLDAKNSGSKVYILQVALSETSPTGVGCALGREWLAVATVFSHAVAALGIERASTDLASRSEYG